MELTRILVLGIAFCLITVLSLGTSKLFALALELPRGFEITAAYLGILFPLFFIGSIILGSRFSGKIARAFYTTISIIAGYYFYFLLGAALLAVFFLGERVLQLTFSSVPTAWFLCVVSFLFASLGLLQALLPKKTRYTIPTTLLPASWRGKKAVLISDTHFGLVNQVHLAKKTTDEIRNIHPDFILMAGDFFDGPAFNMNGIAPFWQSLAHDYPIFYAPGNHELYGPYQTFMSTLRSWGFTVLEDQTTVYEGVTIAGLTYRSKKTNVEEIFAKLQLPAGPTIMINHPPIFLEAFAKANIALTVSGHTHNGQFWPLGYITRAIYGKYNYGKHTVGNMVSITSNGVGTSGPPLRLFNRPEIVTLTFE